MFKKAKFTHHLYIRGYPRQKVQQLIVINGVRVSQLLGEFIYPFREK